MKQGSNVIVRNSPRVRKAGPYLWFNPHEPLSRRRARERRVIARPAHRLGLIHTDTLELRRPGKIGSEGI